MMLAEWVLAEGIVGMTEASAMCRPRPRTAQLVVHHRVPPRPHAQVPTGW